jgi:hypothetical protein
VMCRLAWLRMNLPDFVVQVQACHDGRQFRQLRYILWFFNTKHGMEPKATRTIQANHTLSVRTCWATGG